MASRTLVALFLGLSLFVDAQTPHKSVAAPGPKSVPDEQLYSNPTLGFRYQIPYGWVDRTKEMNAPASVQTADSPAASESTSPRPGSKPAYESAPATGAVLLAIFERPPNAPGDTVNSTVLIASESAAAYPGLKKAEDYLGPLTELATAKDFKPEGEPGFIAIDSRQLVRADFIKPITDKLTMHQSTLVMLAKGEVVSFTFIAGSEDEIDDLIDELHFTAKSTAPPSAKK
ncbi:MAG: hypothetical protein WAU58_12900 [Terriglobales bacterium]